MSAPHQAARGITPHLPWLARAERKRLTASDGVPIAYERVGGGKEAIVLANGLGGRLYAWEALVEHLAPRYTIITWDYRGLFDSGMPERLNHLGVGFHASDLRQILDAEGLERAHLFGWSMGVQVALEFAVLHPERTGKLVLINGTHGHALTTAFQPLLRTPALHRYLHDLLDYVARHPRLMSGVGKLMRSRLNVDTIGGSMALLRWNKKLRENYQQYQNDVFGGSFHGFLRLFQELDAHSVYHHLRYIEHETLLISGALDPLTPAYQTREMKRKMPNARHVSFKLGTHFVLLEYPKETVAVVDAFLAEHKR